MSDQPSSYPPIPVDDPSRALTFTQLDGPVELPHIGLVGDTYTVTVSGAQTNGRFCVIDMLIPPGGGPSTHRHDYEETFILLEGEIELTFRGQKSTAYAGTTVNIPSNAPHQFHNIGFAPAHMICICSPAGIDQFFAELGVPVATRTTAPPPLDEAQMGEFLAKARALAPKYRTELLPPA